MRVHFSTDDLPLRDREAFWQDVIAKQVMSITPRDRPDPAALWTLLGLQVVGRFKLYEIQSSHRSGGRTAADVSRDSSNNFHFRRISREEIYTSAPTRAITVEVRLAPGDFCVTPGDWPNHSAVKDGTSTRGLIIPHRVLSPLLAGGHLTRPVHVLAGSPLGSLLGAAFDTAASQVPLLSPEVGDAVLQNLCGLVALACGASDEGRWSGRESLRTARLEAAKHHIDQHLAEPDLTPASTAAALGISVRHLHLLFEPTGTSFTQYVTERRLLQCRDTLTSPIGASRSVADIAFGWGFNSLATFYRVFEREFGVPPATLRS